MKTSGRKSRRLLFKSYRKLRGVKKAVAARKDQIDGIEWAVHNPFTGYSTPIFHTKIESKANGNFPSASCSGPTERSSKTIASLSISPILDSPAASSTPILPRKPSRDPVARLDTVICSSKTVSLLNTKNLDSIVEDIVRRDSGDKTRASTPTLASFDAFLGPSCTAQVVAQSKTPKDKAQTSFSPLRSITLNVPQSIGHGTPTSKLISAICGQGESELTFEMELPFTGEHEDDESAGSSLTPTSQVFTSMGGYQATISNSFEETLPPSPMMPSTPLKVHKPINSEKTHTNQCEVILSLDKAEDAMDLDSRMAPSIAGLMPPTSLCSIRSELASMISYYFKASEDGSGTIDSNPSTASSSIHGSMLELSATHRLSGPFRHRTSARSASTIIRVGLGIKGLELLGQDESTSSRFFTLSEASCDGMEEVE